MTEIEKMVWTSVFAASYRDFLRRTRPMGTMADVTWEHRCRVMAAQEAYNVMMGLRKDANRYQDILDEEDPDDKEGLAPDAEYVAALGFLRTNQNE